MLTLTIRGQINRILQVTSTHLQNVNPVVIWGIYTTILIIWQPFYFLSPTTPRCQVSFNVAFVCLQFAFSSATNACFLVDYISHYKVVLGLSSVSLHCLPSLFWFKCWILLNPWGVSYVLLYFCYYDYGRKLSAHWS